jgi:hypothetical protein
MKWTFNAVLWGVILLCSGISYGMDFNFVGSGNGGGSSSLQSYTVATLPTGVVGRMVYVTDGASSSDCSVGLGTTLVPCIFNGAAYVSIGVAGASTVSDAAYDATGWNGDTTNSPSKNAIRDKLEALNTALLASSLQNSLFNAHTVLAATTDDTPAALTVGEQTVVGRATGGNIAALSIDSDLSSVSANDDTVPSAKAVKAVTDTLVTKALYDANTILYATTDNTPAALTVAEDKLVGRATGGNIAGIGLGTGLSITGGNLTIGTLNQNTSGNAATATALAADPAGCTNQFTRDINASGTATCASVAAADITTNTITATQLAAALTFADGDFLDLSAITMSGTNDEGIAIPYWANTTPTNGATKRFLTWDESSGVIKIYTASGWVTINPSSGAPTDAPYLVVGSLSASLSGERLMTEGLAIDFTDAGANGNFTIAFDPTELTGDRTWAAGGAATTTWTWDVSTGADPTLAFGNGLISTNSSFTVATGKNITVGTTQWNSGDSIDGTKVANADLGAVSVSSGVWSLDNGTVAAAKLADADFGPFTVASGVVTIDADSINDTHIDWGTGANQVSMDDIPNGSSFEKVAAADVDSNGHVNVFQDSDGTGSISVTGLTAARAKTVRDAADTLLELGGSYTPTGTWNWTSATVTWPTSLNALNSTTSAANMLPYYTGSGTASTTSLTAFGRSLIDDADASTARTTLGLAIGTDVQAYNAALASIAGLTETAGGTPYFTASNTWAVLAAGSAGQISRFGASTAPTWSTFTIPDTIALGSVFAANSLNTLTAITSTSGTKFLQNADGVISWQTGVGTIGGSTGSTDNALLTANGTGGSTLQANSSTSTLSDAGLLTVPTLSSGAGGFTVDADGDVVAKSITISKVSGLAGILSLYEANSTDMDYSGRIGPSSITANTSYLLRDPNARATSGNMVLAYTNSGESGSGTPADPYIQVGSWADLDDYVAKAGATMTGKLTAVNSGTSSGLNVGYWASPPASPVNGDCWTTASGAYCQINGSTVGPFGAAGAAGNFDTIGTGTNTTATMTVGAGASVVPTSTGIIEATRIYAAADTPATKYITFTGVSAARAKTVRDAADTILELGGSYTPTGTWTNMVLAAPNLGTPSALTLTNATGLPIAGLTASTSTALGVGSIELGHASDTTLARVGAGQISVEGVNVVTTSSTDTLTNKTLTTPVVGNGATSAGYIEFREDTDNGTNYVRLAPAESLAGDYNVVLPSASTTLIGKNTPITQCAVIPAAAATDDLPIFKAPAALTIVASSIHVYAIGGTNVVGGLDECTGTNGVCSSVTAVDADITGTAGSDVADDGSLTNGGIASGNWIQWHTTSVSGTNTSLSVCFSYTLD